MILVNERIPMNHGAKQRVNTISSFPWWLRWISVCVGGVGHWSPFVVGVRFFGQAYKDGDSSIDSLAPYYHGSEGHISFAASRRGSGNGRSQTKKGQVMTILIVDDEPNVSALLTRMLEGLGATLVYADSLASAMDQMSKIPPPDLVLLDLRLPPHGAKDTLNAVNAFRQYNPDLIVIPISGMRLEDISDVVSQTGVNVQAIICKDDELSQNRLLRIIRPLLEKSSGLKDSCQIMERIQYILHPETKP